MAKNARKTGADFIADRPEHCTHRFRNASLRRITITRALLQAMHGSISKHYVKRIEILNRAAVNNAVRTRGIVADAAAHRVVTTGGWIRGEHPAERRKVGVELVQYHAWFHPRATALGVYGNHLATIRAQIKDDRLVHTLAVQTGAATTRQDGNALPRAPLHHANSFVDIANNHCAERIDLEQTGIRGVNHPPRTVRTNIRAANLRETCNDAGSYCISGANGVQLRKGNHLVRPGALVSGALVSDALFSGAAAPSFISAPFIPRALFTSAASLFSI